MAITPEESLAASKTVYDMLMQYVTRNRSEEERFLAEKKAYDAFAQYAERNGLGSEWAMAAMVVTAQESLSRIEDS